MIDPLRSWKLLEVEMPFMSLVRLTHSKENYLWTRRQGCISR